MATRRRTRREAGGAPSARGSLARLLLVVLLPLSLGPLVTFAIIIYRQTQTTINTQVTAQLTTLATLKEGQINQWATSRVADVRSLARSPLLLQATRQHLAGTDSGPAITEALNHFLIGNDFFEAAMLADSNSGRVLFSTLQFQYNRFIGETFLQDFELARARQAAFMLPPVFEPRVNDVQVLIAAPVVDPDQGTVALVYGFVRDEHLLDIVAPTPGLGRSGRAYVITADGYPLGSFVTAAGATADSEGIRRARMDQQNGSGIYADASGQPVLGVYRWLPQYEMAILVEQSTAEAFAPLRQFAGVLVGVSAAAVAVSALGLILFTRRLLTGPIQSLTESAQRLAGGDLTAMVQVNRRDELGVLGEAFNSMAAELRGLYQDLEAKVEARTQQLATAAEVGRAATATLSTDELLARVVDLIRDRFGYDHVSVFTLDETGRWAELRESTGEAGAQLKARGHRLAVGSNSLIGWVTANRKPRIALDVGDDVYFQNELLPETRSEAALPLRVSDRLIGALDVQSRSLNAFNQADLEVLQVLADQIAVGLENGRLFARQERLARLEQQVSALTARLHRSLTLDGILESAAADLGQVFGARQVVVRLTPEAQAALAGETVSGADDPAVAGSVNGRRTSQGGPSPAGSPPGH